MDIKNKATRINLFNFTTPQMRAFHMSWFSFFLCFFAWFGIAPLMPIVRDELGLTKVQIGNTIIASVAITILARLFIGWLCDKIGPRLCYTWLLVIASIPVMGIGLANSYETFLLFRLGIGAIGASFVITQYHTSVMFAPNCVGTANATSAGWGNLGGGVTQMIMPLIFAGFIGLGYTKGVSWRLSMVVAGGICMLVGILYFFLTTDFPNGNMKDLKASGEWTPAKKEDKGSFFDAAKDFRVWMLFFIYAACFGIELTINNIAALYFRDQFGLGLKTAGLVAGLFGLMNIFARTTGGIIGDLFGKTGGLKGRVKWLFIAVFVEGIALIFFSRMTVLPVAIGVMIVFSLFVQMSEGATYSVVPFINKRALGSVSGIVGAGGNLGAVAAGFLFRTENLSYQQALLILGFIVIGLSFCALLVRFTPEAEAKADEEFKAALEERKRLAGGKKGFELPDLLGKLKDIKPMDALRIYLGIALAIKGVYFLVNMHELENLSGSFGNLQLLAGWYVVFAHAVGGTAIALGLATRISAIINIPVLLGAIFFVHGAEGLFAASQGLEFTIFVLVSLILLVWNGAGSFSLDRFLNNDEEAHS